MPRPTRGATREEARDAALKQKMADQTSALERWSEDLPAQARRAFAVGRALCACDGHYHAVWGTLRASSEQLVHSMRNAGLSILSENSAPRQRRIVGGAALVDSCSIIIAGK